MSELATFLLARLAEERIIAREAIRDPWRVGHKSSCDWWGDMPGYCTCDAVARLLVDSEAKRRIVQECAGHETCGGGYDECSEAALLTLRHLSAVYADHPRYDEAWKP